MDASSLRKRVKASAAAAGVWRDDDGACPRTGVAAQRTRAQPVTVGGRWWWGVAG